jgi:DNA-binding beta-propeller fold protein YncE
LRVKKWEELPMAFHQSCLGVLFMLGLALGSSAHAADLIVSAQDGKFVRVEGKATYPQPAPSDSLAILDASQSPPALKAVVEGIEHTISGPPQAVAITPDGKLAIIGAPSRYDYDAKKESFGTYLQVVDLEASPPKLTGKVEIGAHPNGLAINPRGDLLIAAATDGTVRVVTISGKELKLAGTIKVGEKRLSGASFTHDGGAALVALRDEGGLAVLDVEGQSVTLSKERISTGIGPYNIDISSDGRWAAVGNAGLGGLMGRTSPGDADLVTLIDVSKRPFRAAQHLTVPAIPEGVALSPDGKWLAVQCMNGSNLTPTDPGPGRQKLGKVVLFSIGEGGAVKAGELPGGEAAQGIVFATDNKTILVQFNVEKELAVYQVRDGGLVDTEARIKLDAGPVSIRTMPR